MDDSAPVRPGEMLLGKYRVERVLGQGGMGVVVAAKHVQLGELFAIKFLLPSGLENPLAIERFLREARAAARLRSEHVTKVVDVGRLPNGAPYMVMEHLHGEDLRVVAKASGPLPVRVAVDYVLQACEALAEAHAAGIVHRDIKPSNLFLTHRPNGTACVKVLDFGISKQISGDDAELTRTGDLVGSPLYMSPEQLTRAREVDTRADIWSLGMVLFKLLTGKIPFFGDSLPEIIGRVLQDEETTPPSAVRPGLPPALDTVVGRCLKKSPSQRYARIEDLMGDLRAVLQGLEGDREIALSAPPPAPLATPDAPPSSRDDGAAPAEAAWRGRSETPTGSGWGRTGGRETPPPASSRVLKVALALVAVLVVAGLSVFLTLRFGAQSASSSGLAAAPSSAASPGPELPATALPAPPTVEPAASSSASTAASPGSTSSAGASATAGGAARSNTFGGPRKKHEGIY